MLSTYSERHITDWNKFRDLRMTSPLVWDEESKMFIAYDHETVLSVFQNRSFKVDYPWRKTSHIFGKTLLDMEGDLHIHLKKKLVSSVLKESNLNLFREHVAEPNIIAIVDQAMTNSEFEFNRNVARRVPTCMTLALLGFDLKWENWLFERVEKLMSHLDGLSEDYSEVNRLHKEVDEWLEERLVELIDTNSDRPYNILFDPIQDETLEIQKIVYWTFIAGGIETSMCLISNAYSILTNHLNYYEKLANDTESSVGILEEILRLEPVQTSTIRYAVESVDINGQLIQKGSLVNLRLDSALHDEKIHQLPDAFDPERTSSRRLVFATGPHACLGKSFTLGNTELVLKILFNKLRKIDRIKPIKSNITGRLFRIQSEFKV